MSTEDAAARGWNILEHWPVVLVARRLGETRHPIPHTPAQQ